MIKISNRVRSIFKRYSWLMIFLAAQNCNAAMRNYAEITEAEFRQLPPFCKYGFERYNLGGGWLNHLCPGLNALNHAKRIIDDNEERRYALVIAVGELNYTIKNAKDFPLRSTVFIKRGNAYEMQNNIHRAIEDYQEAIRIKPKNQHAYAALGQAYAKLGDKKQAIEIIKKGLRFNPNSKILANKLKKLQNSK